MKCALVLSALVAVALAQPLEVSEEDLHQWELFKITYERDYANDEEYRKSVFMDNLRLIKENNAKYESGESTFKLGVTQFADLTNQEFRAQFANLKVSQKATGNEVYTGEEDDSALPAAIDWRKKGAVTAVKDQGNCGSCWSFSATGSMEGQHYIKTNKLVSLSEQNLIDCAVTSGCSGSNMDTAFAYVIKNKGIDTEASYKYTGTDSSSCKYKSKSSGATISSYVDIQSGSESALQKAVANVGPISVAIDATSNLQLYTSGVLNDSNCGSSSYNLNHGVLAVGYGNQKKGGNYWLVKNSWGASWGMKGYFMLARNEHNMCGIATMASYPKV